MLIPVFINNNCPENSVIIFLSLKKKKSYFILTKKIIGELLRLELWNLEIIKSTYSEKDFSLYWLVFLLLKNQVWGKVRQIPMEGKMGQYFNGKYI